MPKFVDTEPVLLKLFVNVKALLTFLLNGYHFLNTAMSILLQTWTSVPREVQDVALTPAAATLPEDSRVPAMTDMPETAQPATVSQYKQ